MINFELKDATNKSFAHLMEVEPVEIPRTPPQYKTFASRAQAFQPMPGFSGVFGGHVLAQAVVAGAQTVGEKQVCHSLHSYFLQRGDPHLPFIYAVENLRNGNNYQSRGVRVYQTTPEDEDTFEFTNTNMIFCAMLSYKIPQGQIYDWSAPYPEKYGRTDDDIVKMEMANDHDAPVLLKFADEYGIESQWHPIDCRKMDTRDDNLKIAHLSDRRIIHYFRSPFELGNNYNIHVALLLYISDRNSLFTLVNIQDDPMIGINQIASVDHQFVLHRLDTLVDQQYLMMETWSDSAADSRGIYNGRMFDDKKRLVASFMQDGVVKVFPLEKL